MKKSFRIALILIFILSVIFLCSCDKKNNFLINFEVDGTTYNTITTTGNEKIETPDKPEKEGYIFDGWYFDKDSWQKPFTINSLLDTPINENLTVYARWKNVPEYVINFEVDGSTYNTITTTGNEEIKTPDNPEKEGYIFDGWYFDKDNWQNQFTINSLLDTPIMKI
jgi:uncharacterized repeat protein (TIGR02543 family)